MDMPLPSLDGWASSKWLSLFSDGINSDTEGLTSLQRSLEGSAAANATQK